LPKDRFRLLGKARIASHRNKTHAQRFCIEIQRGFRNARSFTDTVFALRQTGKALSATPLASPLHIAFADLTKPYAMVSRKGLYVILQKRVYPLHFSALSGCCMTTWKHASHLKTGHAARNFGRWGNNNGVSTFKYLMPLFLKHHP